MAALPRAGVGAGQLGADRAEPGGLQERGRRRGGRGGKRDRGLVDAELRRVEDAVGHLEVVLGQRRRRGDAHADARVVGVAGGGLPHHGPQAVEDGQLRGDHTDAEALELGGEPVGHQGRRGEAVIIDLAGGGDLAGDRRGAAGVAGLGGDRRRGLDPGRIAGNHGRRRQGEHIRPDRVQVIRRGVDHQVVRLARDEAGEVDRRPAGGGARRGGGADHLPRGVDDRDPGDELADPGGLDLDVDAGQHLGQGRAP